MWEQTDCVDYLKTAAVLAAYIDQSLSTNTFYNPANYDGGKVPGTLIAKNLMLAYKWGIKTMYYSLINKVGAKASMTSSTSDATIQKLPNIEPLADEDCEACKL
jgi:ribonucleoside-diphosphate reductase alpha chain